MTEDIVHVVNQAPDLVHRITPFPRWLDQFLDGEIKDIQKEMTYVEISSGTSLYEIACTNLVKSVRESFRISTKDSRSPATRILEKLARIARQGAENVKELTDEEKLRAFCFFLFFCIFF